MSRCRQGRTGGRSPGLASRRSLPTSSSLSAGRRLPRVPPRRAEPGDAPAIADTFLAARAEMTYLPRLHSDDETRAFIREVVMRDLEVWVCEEDGGILGFAALGEDMLEHLYVRPGAQGRGVGSDLLTLAKERRPGGF